MTISPELTLHRAAAAALAVGRAGAELAEPHGLRELGAELAVPVVATLPGTGSLYRRLGDGRWWLVEPLVDAAVLDPAQVARLQPCGPPGPHLPAHLTH